VEEADVQVWAQPVYPGASALTAASASSSSGKNETSRFWLWIVADNLKFAAQNAIACAVELNRLRPRGSVQ